MKRLVLIACLTLFFSSGAYTMVPTGADRFLAEFDFKYPIKWSLEDDLKHTGCMPRPQIVKDAYEAELRRAGIKIAAETPTGNFIFYIYVFGIESDGLCSIVVDVDLSKMMAVTLSPYSNSTDITLMAPRVWYKRLLLTGPKASMQRTIEETAREMVNDLFLELARAKD